MNFDQFFFDDTDEEKEVNILVFEFFKDTTTLLLASTSTTPRIPHNLIVGDHHSAHDRLVAAYFAEQPMYTSKQFHERFRMRRKLFNRIVRDLSDKYPYFQQSIDVVKRFGIFALVKCTSVIRQLVYDYVLDSLDGYLQIGCIDYAKWLGHNARLDFVISSIGGNINRKDNGISRMIKETSGITCKKVHEASRKDVKQRLEVHNENAEDEDVESDDDLDDTQEGSAHDTRVFLHAINTQAMNFPKPPEGYPKRNGYLVPYYKISSVSVSNEPPTNTKEAFNRSHSSLRSYIERSFGILKKRWKLLGGMP
nr:hypothetical protein [Tanacetum cinerariifolium]